MNAELLVAHFSRISNAPDAILRLRSFILDLAVRGKLVDHDPKDESAAKLISRIALPNPRLAGKGAAAARTIVFDANDPAPFDIPASWIWVSLGEICSKTGSGSTPRGGKSVYQKSGVPFLRSQNVHNDGLRLDDVAYISEETHERMSGTAVKPNDLLLNITGGSIGRCCLVSNGLDKANISQHVAIIRSAIAGVHEYLHALILSPYFQSFVVGEQTGAGRLGLPKNRMDAIPVALPPLPEQRRIVAKVNELMALCDGLEARQREQELGRNQLTTSTHHHLSNEADPKSLAARAQFFIGNLSQLVADHGQIKQLRQTILNLAVRGYLVPQDSEERDTENALAAIKEERERRIACGQLKKVAAMKTTGNEAKFDSQIPSSWISCFVDDIAMKVTDGEHITPERSKSGHFLLSARNVTNDGIELSDVDFVPESEFLRIRKRCDPGKGDILISCSGSVGRVAVVDRDDAYTMVRSAALIKLDSSRINSEYVAFALRADRYNGRFWRTRSQRPRLISSSARFAGFAFLYHPSRNNAA